MEEQGWLVEALRGSIPALVSIVVGGLFASILFPRWHNSYTRYSALVEHRFALIEAIATQLSAYVTAWRRLIQIASLESERALSDVEATRMAAFVNQRNEGRDALWASFARGQFYFTDTACDVISKFMAWDEEQVAKPLAELPNITEWRKWEARVLAQLKRDERPEGFWRF